MTATIAISCSDSSLKASFAMKIETVKPIPAALPVDRRSSFPFLDGISATFNREKREVKATIPSGLPTTKAIKIANAIDEPTAAFSEVDEISTPVFARAKIGTTRKLDHGCRRASSSSD
jgi:hypothetical protein